MPKEKACLSEHSPCPPSSKNAKDKSNSTTLQALRDSKGADDSYRRGSSCSSEKDSGYSDGSDWQQTDVEDQRRNRHQSKAAGQSAGASPAGQKEEAGPKNFGHPGTMPAKLSHPPIYIIKDMVLKQAEVLHNVASSLQQPALMEKGGQLLWTSGVRISSQSPHMILFEQPGLLPAAAAAPRHRRPPPKPSNAKEKRASGTYLPILNSYPRIAPHPSKKPPDKSTSSQEYQSKRVCTEHGAGEAPASRGRPEQLLLRQSRGSASQPGPSGCSPAASCLTPPVPTAPAPDLRSPSTSSPAAPRSAGARHRRFLNTVEILRQSGLLDITLRTKELLRQSNATERDISQLRQHTQLLWQAARSPARRPGAAWERLHHAMAESGSYPDLQIRPPAESPWLLGLVSRPEGFPAGGASRPPSADSSEAPPSCLLASMLEHSHLQQGDKPSDKVPFMSPDSSTG
ncbi:CLOCK-interacting pacemaker isoform 1-T2 [Menidia menidia]